MSDNPADAPVMGCVIILAIILAAPFFIAAIPVLAGLFVGVVAYLIWVAVFRAIIG